MQRIGPQKLKAEHLGVFNNLRKITLHYGDLNYLLNPWRLSGLEFFAVNWSTFFIPKAELLDRMATTEEAESWIICELLMIVLMLCFCCVASSYDYINGNLVVVMHLMLIRPSVSQYVLRLPQAQVYVIPIINLFSGVCFLFLLSGLFKSTHLCRLLQMPSLLFIRDRVYGSIDIC